MIFFYILFFFAVSIAGGGGGGGRVVTPYIRCSTDVRPKKPPLLFLNQRKRENGRRNVFMTKTPRKNVPDVGIELRVACMPGEHASDRVTAPGILVYK